MKLQTISKYLGILFAVVAVFGVSAMALADSNTANFNVGDDFSTPVAVASGSFACAAASSTPSPSIATQLATDWGGTTDVVMVGGDQYTFTYVGGQFYAQITNGTGFSTAATGVEYADIACSDSSDSSFAINVNPAPTDVSGSIGATGGTLVTTIGTILTSNFPLLLAIAASLIGLGILVFYVRRWIGRK